MSLHKYFIFAAIIVSVFTGCGKQLPQRPNGLPETTPCTLEISFGGKRIEGVSVLLKSKNSVHKWAAGGSTDSEGKAKLKTGGYFDGVVPGEYVVSFQKVGHVELDKNDMPIRSHSVIPIKYTAGKSKLNITVTKKQSVYPFELDGGEEVQK